jgi:hypothetical protein
MLSLIREFVLILAIGALGGHLLITLNHGKPIGMRAEAAGHVNTSRHLLISDLEYRLDTNNPAEVENVVLEAALPNGSLPQGLQVDITSGNTQTTYRCQLIKDNKWTCRTPGLYLRDMTEISASET